MEFGSGWYRANENCPIRRPFSLDRLRKKTAPGVRTPRPVTRGLIVAIMTSKISPEVVDQRTDQIGARLNEIEQTLATRKPDEN
jgi:hypothetical protein